MSCVSAFVGVCVVFLGVSTIRYYPYCNKIKYYYYYYYYYWLLTGAELWQGISENIRIPNSLCMLETAPLLQYIQPDAQERVYQL